MPMRESMPEPSRNRNEERKLQAMLDELGWGSTAIRRLEEEARRRRFLFREVVAAALYLGRSRMNKEVLQVDIEWEFEYDPCELMFYLLRHAGPYGIKILDGLRRQFRGEGACEWLMKPNPDLNGRPPSELIYSGNFREISEFFPT